MACIILRDAEEGVCRLLRNAAPRGRGADSTLPAVRSRAFNRYVGQTVQVAYYGNKHMEALQPFVSRSSVYLPGLKQVKEYDAAVGAYSTIHHAFFDAILRSFCKACTSGHLQTEDQLLEHVAEKVKGEMRLKPT